MVAILGWMLNEHINSWMGVGMMVSHGGPHIAHAPASK